MQSVSEAVHARGGIKNKGGIETTRGITRRAARMIQSPELVLNFWFDEAGPKRWWSADPAFDAAVRDRFQDLHASAGEGVFDDWCETARGALALVILLDQIPRNMYRGTPEAYSTDRKALEVAREALELAHDAMLTPVERHFLYMPFTHSESLEDQERGIALGEALEKSQGKDDTDFLRHARMHRDVIHRYGRFPHRNPILGRSSTPDEEAYLAQGKGWR